MLASLLTSTTEWIIHGDGDLAGSYVGAEEVFSFWRKVATKTHGGLRLTLIDVLANDARGR